MDDRDGESVDDRFAQARKVLKANFGKFCLAEKDVRYKLLSRILYQEGRVRDLEYARILLSSRLRRGGKKVPTYTFVLNIEALIT